MSQERDPFEGLPPRLVALAAVDSGYLTEAECERLRKDFDLPSPLPRNTWGNAVRIPVSSPVRETPTR